MNTITRIAASLTLVAASASAFAQTTATPNPAASQPSAVGVTPETAKMANDKAVPRPDVATVVRTGPTAADRARQAGHKVESAAAGTMNAENSTSANRNATLAPRADRN